MILTTFIFGLHATASSLSSVSNDTKVISQISPQAFQTISKSHITTVETTSITTTTSSTTPSTNPHPPANRALAPRLPPIPLTATATDPLQCIPIFVPYFGDKFPQGCQAYMCLDDSPRSMCPLRPATTTEGPWVEPTPIVKTYSWTTVTRPCDWASRAEDCTVTQVPYFGGKLRNGCEGKGVLLEDTLALGPSAVV